MRCEWTGPGVAVLVAMETRQAQWTRKERDRKLSDLIKSLDRSFICPIFTNPKPF